MTSQGGTKKEDSQKGPRGKEFDEARQGPRKEREVPRKGREGLGGEEGIPGGGRERTAKCTLVRDLLRPCDRPDLVDRPDVGAEPAMDAEHLPVDEGAEREVIKHLAAGLPDRSVAVLLLALVVEAVHLRRTVVVGIRRKGRQCISLWRRSVVRREATAGGKRSGPG